MDLSKDAYAELRTFLRNFDPRHERKEEIFTKLGYIDVKNLAPRIRADVLMGISLMDNICPPSTQYAVLNNICSPKEAVIYPDFGHENLPGFSDRAFDFLLGL
jgi:cephalosporin-C deacetylase